MDRFHKLLAEVTEKEDEKPEASQNKKSLINYIASMFNRYATGATSDNDRAVLMLIAALNVLNSSDDPQTFGIARRLAQLSTRAAGRK